MGSSSHSRLTPGIRHLLQTVDVGKTFARSVVSGSDVDHNLLHPDWRPVTKRLVAAVLVILVVLVVRPAMSPAVHAVSLPTILPNPSIRLQHVSEPHVMKMLPGKTQGGTGARRSSPLTESNLVINPVNGSPSYVQTQPSIYISFWGSDWQSGFTDNNGFTGSQATNYVQTFLNLVGGSTWFNSQSQYCQGIPAGTQICPVNGHVQNPTGLVQGVALEPRYRLG
jgi:hypothetical protein